MGIYSLTISSVIVTVALACSPEGYRFNIPLDEMANKSPIIALGTVTETYPMSVDKQSYIAELDVTCSYKGGPLPSSINITDAGSWPGICGYRNFTVGVEYFVFLEDLGGKYSQMYDETMPMMTALNELLTFCDLSVVYPYDSSSNRSCIPSLKYGCKSFTDSPPSPPSPSQGQPAPPPPNVSKLLVFDEEMISSGEMEPMSSTMEMDTNKSMTMTNETFTAKVEVTTTEGTTLPVNGASQGVENGQTIGESSGVRKVMSTVCLCVCIMILSLL